MERWLPPARAALAMAAILLLVTAMPALGNIPAAICWGVLFAHLHHRPEWTFRGSRWASLAALLPAAAIVTDAHFAAVAFSLALLVFTCAMREDHVLRPLLA